MKHDAFICHASEDKEEIARPLAGLLKVLGYGIWYDEHVLKLGDSLRGKIDSGLASSKYGIVILSHNFFTKKWTKYELDGLTALAMQTGNKVILPVWHKISEAEILRYSPSLAGTIAVKSEHGLEEVARKITDVLGPPKKSRKTRRPELAGIVYMGLAGPGAEIFISRRMKVIALFRDGEPSDILDAYHDHSLYKHNPHVPAEGRRSDESAMTHVVDIPPEADWYLRFYRLDFPPLDRWYSNEILTAIDSGQYYSQPLKGLGTDYFEVTGLADPIITAMFTLRSEDGRLSVVAAVGPGPA